jgi:hypothetical protein
MSGWESKMKQQIIKALIGAAGLIIATICGAFVTIEAPNLFHGTSPSSTAPSTNQPTSIIVQQPSPTPTQIPFVATTPPQICQGYKSSGKGQTLNVSITVSQGCVMVIDSYQGNINGYSPWSDGGVIAFSAGSYGGYIVDGEYQITNSSSGNALFCQKVQQLRNNNQPETDIRPLSGWSGC